MRARIPFSLLLFRNNYEAAEFPAFPPISVNDLPDPDYPYANIVVLWPSRKPYTISFASSSD